MREKKLLDFIKTSVKEMYIMNGWVIRAFYGLKCEDRPFWLAIRRRVEVLWDRCPNGGVNSCNRKRERILKAVYLSYR